MDCLDRRRIADPSRGRRLNCGRRSRLNPLRTLEEIEPRGELPVSPFRSTRPNGRCSPLENLRLHRKHPTKRRVSLPPSDSIPEASLGMPWRSVSRSSTILDMVPGRFVREVTPRVDSHDTVPLALASQAQSVPGIAVWSLVTVRTIRRARSSVKTGKAIRSCWRRPLVVCSTGEPIELPSAGLKNSIR